MSRPTHLRVEYLDVLLGVGERRPRLSWRLPAGATRQEGYELEIDGVTTAPVDSAGHVLVEWPVESLRSRQRARWRVRVHTDLGLSDWSDPLGFETGLLDALDWTAQWIGPAETEAERTADARPVYLLRSHFDMPDAISGESAHPARVYATALGIYECFLNGSRVGDFELTPGSTSYDTRIQVQAYDVTGLLQSGRNRWDVLLSDGWYRGRNSLNQVRDCYGSQTAFLGQLEVGGEVVSSSGVDWRSGASCIVAADLMRGQSTDLRVVPAATRAVELRPVGLGRLCWSPGPPVRRVSTLRPRSVTSLPDGGQVVDLGQNINGWARIAVAAPAGGEIVLTHAEALAADGDVTREHLNVESRMSGTLDVGMVDRVVSRGDDADEFEPRHTTHGFQYVRIDGIDRPLTVDDVDGVSVHSDLRPIGTFECSDERINWLHEAARWSFLGNACDVPTDCPQRERMGWTGDYQIFVPSAAFLYDVAGFSRKWLLDVMAEQQENGRIINVSPDPLRLHAQHTGDSIWELLQGSAGWGDAITIVPWEVHLATGDRGILDECLDAMIRWVAYASSAAAAGRHPSRVERFPEPAPHERYLWDTGFHFGEWLEPGKERLSAEEFMADKGHVATAYLHRSARIVADAARLSGRHDVAEAHDLIAVGTLDAWRREYIGADGRVTPDSQANHVRALAFGLVPDVLRGAVADRLVELVREAETHLGTGFLSTPFLLPVLADHGYLDVAYELLLQDTPPSWLAMMRRGATTVWESWDGIDAEGHPHESLNHYSKGAVIQFLHRYVAGISPIEGHPGYERFVVAPRPGGGLTAASATHESPYGRISVEWRIEAGAFHLDVTVPPGSTAHVVMPDGELHEQHVGTARYRSAI